MKGTYLVILAFAVGVLSSATIYAQVSGNTSAEKAIEQHVRNFASADEAVRKQAYVALVRIGDPAIPALIRSLNDNRKHVRTAAILTLGRIGDPAITALGKTAWGQKTPTQKAALATIALLVSSGKASDKTRQMLRHRLPKVDFPSVPLELVVQFHREVAKVPIYVQWGRLRKGGIERKSAVRIGGLKNVTAQESLSACLASVSTRQRVTSGIMDGVLVISTEDGLREITKLRLWERFRDLFTDEENRNSRRKMWQVLPKIDLPHVPLNLTLEFLAKTSGLEFSIDWSALRKAGVSKTTPVNVHLRDVSLANTLTFVLVDACNGTVARYTYKSGKIAVLCRAGNQTAKRKPSTEEQAKGKLRFAQSYLSAGLKAKAIKILESVVKDYPDTDAAKEAKKFLANMRPSGRSRG